MPIIALVVWWGLIGLATWLVVTYIPMPAEVKRLIVIAVVILLVLWLVELLGVTSLGPHVPRLGS
jgi:hypothetical protein